MRPALVRTAPALRPFGLAAAAIGIEFARVLAMRRMPVPGALAGGGALLLLAAGTPASRLGLEPGRLGPRLLGTCALAAVLLLPAAVRWTGQPPLTGWFAVAAVLVAAGEEIAFRGVLFAALEDALGPAAAVAGSALAWTAAHAMAHPAAFLPAVLAAGLLLGLWRLAVRDLAAPIAAHALADLAL